MIASYKYGFIFLKTKKTASTSLELALSPLCGPDDIVSPFGARWELERQAMGGGPPRNFSKDPELEERFRAAIETGHSTAIREVALENRRTGGCTGHMNANEVKRWVEPEFWERAVKISSERHPYEKAVSFAHFGFRGDSDEEFREHLEKVVRTGAYRGWRTYAIDGESVVDEWVMQGSIASDVDRIAKRLGLPTPLEIPRARSGERDRTPAHEVLTDEQKRVVQKRCAREFDLFGWER
jgi:hypothetical protein